MVQEYPELVDVLKDLGFSEITKPAMLNSVGRITTIPKGAKMRNISMMKVVPALMSNGFELIGKMPNIFALGKNNAGDETAVKMGLFRKIRKRKDKELFKATWRRRRLRECAQRLRREFFRGRGI
mgnify:FL=1